MTRRSSRAWRRDVVGSADLVEEVTRIIGFDKIAAAPLPRADGVARATATRGQMIERRVRRAAAARGLDEAITWSFISENDAALFGGSAFVLANPISEEMKHMRPSLIPGLAAATRRNLDRGAASVRLFEVGRRYLADGERPTLTLMLAGERSERSWQDGKAKGFDAFDAKAEALAVLEAAGAPVGNLQLFMDAGETWHPGRSATAGAGAEDGACRIRRTAPAHRQGARRSGRDRRGRNLPRRDSGAALGTSARVPPSRRQRCNRSAATSRSSCPADLAADALVRAIKGADKALITDARIFDRYEGEQGLSLAVEVTMQPTEKTLTDAEIGDVSGKIVAAAAKLGATLRS